MAYIGNQPSESFTSFATQEFSTSATTSYTLDHAVTNENEIALFINNVRQQPGSGKAYTATGTALTLSAATASTDTMYCVFLGRALQTVTPATNSITAAMVGNDLISGKDALASAPADTDEFLVSDAGTLKRIDYSLIKAANTPNFFVEDDGAQSINNDTITKLEFATENYDSDSAFASHKFTVPSGEAGKYFLYASWQTASSTDFTSQRIYFYKNGSALGPNIQTDHDHYGSIQISSLENLSASDYIEVYAYHNAGGSINTLGTSKFLGYKIIE